MSFYGFESCLNLCTYLMLDFCQTVCRQYKTKRNLLTDKCMYILHLNSNLSHDLSFGKRNKSLRTQKVKMNPLRWLHLKSPTEMFFYLNQSFSKSGLASVFAIFRYSFKEWFVRWREAWNYQLKAEFDVLLYLITV